MSWLVINGFTSCTFGDLSQIHDGDAIRDVFYDGKVMGDKQV